MFSSDSETEQTQANGSVRSVSKKGNVTAGKYNSSSSDDSDESDSDSADSSDEEGEPDVKEDFKVESKSKLDVSIFA